MMDRSIISEQINCSESVNSTFQFSLDYTLADTYTVVSGAISFCLVLPLVLFTFPCFPIGTTAAVLLGAFLMVATGVLSQSEVYEILGEAPNMRTILLLVSMMMLAQFFERENTLGQILGKILTADQSFVIYIFKVTLVTFLIAAIFTNDAACAIVTPLFIEVWRKQNRPKIELETLLLAIATSANLGSVITIFGNPQNALIASATEAPEFKKSQLNLLNCVKYLWVPAAIGYGFNMAFLVMHFRFRSRGLRAAHVDLTPEEPDKKALERATSYEDKISGRGDTEMRSLTALNTSQQALERPGNSTSASFRFRIFLVALLVAVVALLFVQTKSISFDIALVPLAANVLIMVVDAAFRKRRPADVFKRVDWGIIMMFFGFFVWLGGVNKTRIARWVWQRMGLVGRSATDVESIIILCCFVIFGSNLFSNVPLTIIVLEQLEPCKGQLPTVLYLAWGSTIAGNLTLFGSVANLIVAQQALITLNYNLSFYKYIKFGFLSTLWIVTLGIVIIYGLLLLY